MSATDPRRFQRSPHLVALIGEVERLAALVATADPEAVAELAPARRLAAAHASLALDGADPTALPDPDRARALVAERLTGDGPAPAADARSRGGGWLDTLRVLDSPEDQLVAALELLGVLAADDSDDLVPALLADPAPTLAELHRRLTRGLVADQRAGALREVEQAVHDGATGRMLFLTTTAAALPKEFALVGSWLATTGVREHGVVASGVLHLELLRTHPFDAANGRLARAAARLVLRARGLDPGGLAVPELALAEDLLGSHEEVARTLRRRDLTVWLERWAEAVAEGLRGSARLLGLLQPHTPEPARAFVADHDRFTIADYRAERAAGAEQARTELTALLDAGLIRRVPASRGLRYETVGPA